MPELTPEQRAAVLRIGGYASLIASFVTGEEGVEAARVLSEDIHRELCSLLNLPQ